MVFAFTGQYKHNDSRKTSLSRVGFPLTILAKELVKILLALNRAATVDCRNCF
jgi:hypothetical protein